MGTSASATVDRALHGSVSVSRSGGGRVTSSPSGINCGSDCIGSFPSTINPDYQPVALSAEPNPGWTFAGWGGACSGTGGCTLEITEGGSQSVSATFDPIPASSYPVAVGRTGSGTVTSSPAGISCGSTCSATFDTGTAVSLTAVPAAGWTFGGWSGDCGGNGGCNLTVSSPKSVTAIFNSPGPANFTLGVSTSGAGLVSSSPGGISCGAACAADFASGTAVTLTASSTGSASFAGWGGACSGTGTTCTVTMDGAKSVTASFGQAPPPVFPVTISRGGNGFVTSAPAGVSCGASCSAGFASGASVTLNAAPAAGWRFAGWGGACAGAAPTCTLVVDAPKTVTASFSEIPTSFLLAVTTSGSGSVHSTPAGIDCGGACTGQFPNGGAVALRAVPAKGYTLSAWDGACSGTALVCTVTMDDAKSATASFARLNDRIAPKVRALPSSGRRGGTARLRYRVTDDSGRSSEAATVYRGTRLLATIRGPLDEADDSALYYFLPWHVPRGLRARTVRFCVSATDGASNRSKRSCSSLRVT